ncbi:MAG: zf-HC2 domain-containing protein [Longicatena sp.]
MKEIKCTIIQDILPLYIDEVVGQDTKEMVDEHLQYCEKCQKEYETMNQKLYIPVEGNADAVFKKINKKWRRKKVIISIASIFATATILLGAYLSVFYFDRVIPYSEDLIKIEQQDDGQLVAKYFGKSHAGVNFMEPIPYKIDGKKRNISFIYYTKTIADSPTRNLINDEKRFDDQEYIPFNLVESEKVDVVYYVAFDIEKIIAEKDSWDLVLERAELIWER